VLRSEHAGYYVERNMLGLAPCETATCCQRFGETCYLYLQTKNDRSHITVENPSWCRDGYVARASHLTGSLVCLLSEVKAMRVTIILLQTGRTEERCSLRNGKYSVSKTGRNRGQL
jgi:hypothetical protein